MRWLKGSAPDSTVPGSSLVPIPAALVTGQWSRVILGMEKNE